MDPGFAALVSQKNTHGEAQFSALACLAIFLENLNKLEKEPHQISFTP